MHALLLSRSLDPALPHPVGSLGFRPETLFKRESYCDGVFLAMGRRRNIFYFGSQPSP